MEKIAVALGKVPTTPIPRRVDDRHQCLILNNRDPSKFWVGILDEEIESNRLEMVNTLQTLYKFSEDEKEKSEEMETIRDFHNLLIEDLKCEDVTIENLSDFVGDYVVVYCETDNMFYRGAVLHWFDEQTSAKVLLIDEGTEELVSYSHLYAMSKVLTKYPHYAVPCYLADAYPLHTEPGKPLPQWSTQSLVAFRELAVGEFELTIRELDQAHLPTTFAVSLYNKEKDLDVASAMISQGHAESLEEPPKMPLEWEEEVYELQQNTRKATATETTEAFTGYEPMKAQFESAQNDLGIDMDDPTFAVYGHKTNDETVCKFYAETGQCFKGDSCLKSHIRYLPDGYSTGKIDVFLRAFNDLDRLYKDDRIKIKKITLFSVDEMYVLTESKYEDDLDELEEKINSDAKKLKRLTTAPGLNELVLAKYEDRWVRGRCLQLNGLTGKQKVLYVDYGESEELKEEDLRAIEPQWLHLPLLTRKCCLANVARSAATPNRDVIAAIEDFLGSETSVEMLNIENANSFTHFIDLIGGSGGVIELLLGKGMVKRIEKGVHSTFVIM